MGQPKIEPIEPSKIWQIVKTLEEDSVHTGDRLSEVKATLLVNYGPNGRCRKGLITGEENTIAQLVIVLEYYEKNTKAFEEYLNHKL